MNEWLQLFHLGLSEPGLAELAHRGSFTRGNVNIEYSIFSKPGTAWVEVVDTLVCLVKGSCIFMIPS